MAITKVALFNSSPTNSTDYQAQNAHINAFIQQMSNQVLHLTEWTTTTVPQIAQGVYLRHAGVLYIVDTANFDIATGDLSASGIYHIKLTTSGASLTVEWEDTLTSYAWNIAYQGYYNGTSQLLPYSISFVTAASYTKFSIINMKDSSWYLMSSAGDLTNFSTALQTLGEVALVPFTFTTASTAVQVYTAITAILGTTTANYFTMGTYDTRFNYMLELDASNFLFRGWLNDGTPSSSQYANGNTNPIAADVNIIVFNNRI